MTTPVRRPTRADLRAAEQRLARVTAGITEETPEYYAVNDEVARIVEARRRWGRKP